MSSIILDYTQIQGRNQRGAKGGLPNKVWVPPGWLKAVYNLES